MKEIVTRSGGDAKLRLRGKGSGFVERDTKVESPEPLQLCISCPYHDGYDKALSLAKELLLNVYDEHRQWCSDNGKSVTTPTEINMSEKHLKGDSSYGGNNNRRDRRDRTPPRSRGGKRNQPTFAVGDGPSDGTPAPPEAPPVEEIKSLIEKRNTARRAGDYAEADRIRNHLKDKMVVLSDEKGGYGEAQHVTTWRYWHN